MRCFEHVIECKVDDAQDRLYFLEQYTRGQPKELIKTCLHMDPARGYIRAKALLKKHFGNEFKISNAYIDKALSWPAVKAEDPKALQSFGLYLRGCSNVMEEIAFMEELDLTSNLKSLVSKLPYKLREGWRTKVSELQDGANYRVRFPDLVKFIERQVKILTDPVFGNIQDPTSRNVAKPKSTVKTFKPKSSSSSFATTVDSVTKSAENSQYKILNPTMPFCLFCTNGHVLDDCPQFKKKLHKDKIQFIKEKGICFGCLIQGHMSKACTKLETCKICNQKHPTVLHIGKVDKG